MTWTGFGKVNGAIADAEIPRATPMTKPTAEDERQLLARSFTALNYMIGIAEGLRMGAGIEERSPPKFVVDIEARLAEYLTGEHHKGKD